MTQKQIEQKSIDEWSKLHDGNFPYVIGIEWDYWLKAFQVMLSDTQNIPGSIR